MTLTETEETLQTLRTRHPGLDEAMLVTLLRAGGWEEKQIEEAKAIFRSGPQSNSPRQEIVASEALPPLPDVPVFQATPDNDHLLNAHNEIVEKVVTPEPQSLVSDSTHAVVEGREDLPHNLPLRPFETSEHIWPFSRYRDVFYGDVPVETKKATVQVKTQVYETPPVVQVEVKPAEAPKEIIRERIVERVIEKKVESPVGGTGLHVAPESLSRGDEKLVVMACVMLLVILLLLGYMYSNGRL